MAEAAELFANSGTEGVIQDQVLEVLAVRLIGRYLIEVLVEMREVCP